MRKASHIKICLEEDVQARRKTTGFEDVFLVHRAIPEIKRKKINLSTTVFNNKLSAPLIVGAMTGGAVETTKINAAIAQAVEELGLGMGVGSQRAAISNPKLEHTFAVVREKAPTAFLIANIGAPQLGRGYGVRETRRAVDMMKADVLAIHLNPLQEAVQPEGETDYAGVLKKIGEVAQALDVPVIVKETGAGIAAEEAKMLEAAGVAGIDVAGAGGTSWAAVEYHRAKKVRDESRQRLGENFWDWGIPTAASLVEVVQSVHLTVIASGGIRSGMDVAKALTLGADFASTALPVLCPANRSSEEVKKTLQFTIDELRNAMFLAGAESIQKLRNVPVVIVGKTAEWLRVRGFHPELYARRET
ncbi:MAG: type 2 isopentenyl-diphosphate Delta-isomerase [Candidatus Bathyarchaeota archaeon]|nr:MAG: type 2 isopentenyl-diphosphate Delta-isomerase [Candidatus Bathyarchaeota archaeon]